MWANFREFDNGNSHLAEINISFIGKEKKKTR